jgi:hypothetical protein
VLGISRDDVTSEQEIQRALDNSNLSNSKDSSVLLIQSGAPFPTARWSANWARVSESCHFRACRPLRRTYAGNATESLDPQNFSKSLRLTAARGGNNFIICYWGMLESGTEKLATKTVSWVPVMNWIVPDEKQHARIRLKVAVMEVRTGHWAVFSPNLLMRRASRSHHGAKLWIKSKSSALSKRLTRKARGNWLSSTPQDSGRALSRARRPNSLSCLAQNVGNFDRGTVLDFAFVGGLHKCKNLDGFGLLHGRDAGLEKLDDFHNQRHVAVK